MRCSRIRGFNKLLCRILRSKDYCRSALTEGARFGGKHHSPKIDKNLSIRIQTWQSGVWKPWYPVGARCRPGKDLCCSYTTTRCSSRWKLSRKAEVGWGRKRRAMGRWSEPRHHMPMHAQVQERDQTACGCSAALTQLPILNTP